MLDKDVRRAMKIYGIERARQEYLGLALFGGFGVALFWPVTIPVTFLYRLFLVGDLFRTPIEREEEQREELEALRALAREHNLPMPEAKS
jgi:hypothetical protein